MKVVSRKNPIKHRAGLNRGLLRWWLCLPTRHGGLLWRDLTTKNNATIVGAAPLKAGGRPGGFGYWQFDGTNDSGRTAAIDLSAVSTMTVAINFNWTTFANDNDLMLESSASASVNAGAISIMPNLSAGTFRVLIGTSGAASNSVTFTRPAAATWIHGVFCFDRNAGLQQVVAVYLDGVSQSLSTGAVDTTATGGFGNHIWNFMCRDNASLFGAGKFDDVRIYNRVLGAGEARALYRASRGGYRHELRRIRELPFGLEPAEVEEAEETEVFTVSGSGPLGAEDIPNPTLATAQSLQVPAGTRFATVQAIGANFNYFLSGSTPTTGTTGDGRKLYAGVVMPMTCGFTSAKFIRESDVTNSRLVIEYFSGIT